MVARQKRAMASSEGALLIDELTEWLDEQIDADPERAAGAQRPIPRPNGSPPQVALGYFLPYPVAPRIDFDTDKLLREERERSDGISSAHAPATAAASRPAGRRPAEDPDYRFAVVQSELYRRHLRLAVERLDVRPLAHYLKHLARWYLERERGEHVERVVHTLLDRSARGLGLEEARMSTLLVDNYDSYTYNVFHLLAAVSGEEPIVVHNDMVSWRALSRWDFDAIVLSPGPGRPERWHDFGVCSDILRSSEIPVLGICLGHQGLGHVLNGVGRAAPRWSMHGRLSQVQHLDSGLFAGIPQDFSVVRYHSLAVTGPLGPEGRVTAWTEDGVVMGIEHRSRPMWGVQFHPESIATEHGRAVVENFYAIARAAPNAASRARARRRPPARSQPPVGARLRDGARACGC